MNYTEPGSYRVVNVSLDNIKSAVEAMLRSFGSIDDNENVEIFFELNYPNKGEGLINGKWQPKDVIPVTIITKNEVEIHKLNGTNG